MYDPTYPEIDQSNFKGCNQTKFYKDAKKHIPHDAPKPKDQVVDL